VTWGCGRIGEPHTVHTGNSRVVRRKCPFVHSCPHNPVDNCGLGERDVPLPLKPCGQDDTLDVHMVIHNQWIRGDMSGSARTGLVTVTLCTQLWMGLWMNVQDLVDRHGVTHGVSDPGRGIPVRRGR
jgi:hypothetical protein